MKKAILLGPFVGEMFWEAFRFAPLLPYFKRKKYSGKDITYIILTRPDRFDLYGKLADILVPLNIENDYKNYFPECFRLIDYPITEYEKVANFFKNKYSERYEIIEHVYPNIKKPHFSNKNQFPSSKMIYEYNPRNENHHMIDNYLPTDKKVIVLAPRFRKGFKRNWNNWEEFYNIIANDEKLMSKYNFIICGKKGEYIPDEKHRFYDMNDISLNNNSSLIGLLIVILRRAYFTVGSQSAVPNLSLLHGVEVLEFGCQKTYHTKTYNIKNTPVTFIENKKYNIPAIELYNNMVSLLKKKEK